MSAVAEAGLPRIYMLPAAVVCSSHANAWVKHIQALEFSHLLVAHDRADDGATAALPPDVVDTLGKLCKRASLTLLIDINMASVASQADVRQAHPDWFAQRVDPDALPDPRFPPSSRLAQWRLNDAQVAAAASAWWSNQLGAYLDAGVGGFRLLGADVPAADWWSGLLNDLRQRSASAVFIAATDEPASASQGLLKNAGFDHVLCALAPWDFHSPWLGRELDRLRTIAPPLAMAGVPRLDRRASSPRHEGSGQRDAQARAHARAAWLSAGCAAGWVMPGGFEFGAVISAERELPAQSPKQWAGRGVIDIADAVTDINRWLAEKAAAQRLPTVHVDVGVVALWRSGDQRAELVLINSWLDRSGRVDLADIAAGKACAYGPWQQLGQGVSVGNQGLQLAPLAPGEVRVLQAAIATVVTERHTAAARGQRLGQATAMARVAIEAVSPVVDGGRFPVKRVVGDTVTVTADVFMDGHDHLAVYLRWRAIDEKRWHESPMQRQGNDRYAGTFTPPRVGRYEYAVIAWRDAWESYEHELIVKHEAGQVITLELEEGRRLVESFVAKGPTGSRQTLRPFATRLRKETDEEACYKLLVDPALRAAMQAADPRAFLSEAATLSLEVDRRAAQFASWYELFPRSESGEAGRHGTLRDVIKRLPAIRDMGFDVLYFPPIHPIGTAFRKGPNNTLEPGPDDPGSPYAIGSPDGGHTAIHPQLGTLEDFRALRDAAHAHGLELALDFAIQCSPDHPWLAEHPGWFDWRPDGSIRYAENPPKKYQDIVNVDFYADAAVPSLWQALCDAVLFWAGEGVRIFRVDNPHTKPLPFWEWMIARVREPYPDALFLAEAFTRPKPMYRLAKAGFGQSYTYFTWRHTKQEFTVYLTELSDGPPKDFFRPHFFVNTPDINPYFLQRSGRSGFLIRAALATTLSGLWGMYAGFELCEAAPMPGKEEYLDSEKYQLRQRDYAMPGNIIAEITQLNVIRRAHPALQSHLGVRFLAADNPNVLFFEKVSPSERDRVLVAINLDPHSDQSSALHLPLGHWGVAEDAPLAVRDLLHDAEHIWRGGQQQLWLGRGLPYAIWHIETGA